MARVGAADVEVAVLGPTLLGGCRLTPRQGAVVAALACHRDGLSTDALVDAVWGVNVPATARPALHNQIARLRQRFGDDVIVTEATTYRLDRPSDAELFESIVGPWVGGPAASRAIEPLAGALALWRGGAYADLADHGPGRAESFRLGEVRDLAAERLAACRIAVGDLPRAISALYRLVEEEPYRERRTELLALALHLAGRETEAVRVCDRLAATLASDLGCVPSTSVLQVRDVAARGPRLTEDDVRIHLDGIVVPKAIVPPLPCSRRAQQRQRTACRGS